MGYIYCITNLVNSKRYIGKTENSIQERWKEHCRARKNPQRERRPLYDAFDKYGIENFKIEEIEYVENNSKLADREIYWIQEFQTYGRKGYNATKGGDGITLYNHEEIIELYHLGYQTIEISQKIGCSQTCVDKVLKAHGIKSRGRSKMIDQYDKAGNYIQTFDNVMLAVDWLINNGITNNKNANSKLTECCKNQRKSAYNYIWKYRIGGEIFEKPKKILENPYDINQIHDFLQNKNVSKEDIIDVYNKYKDEWIRKGIFTYYAEDYFKYKNSPKLYNSNESYILYTIYKCLY